MTQLEVFPGPMEDVDGDVRDPAAAIEAAGDLADVLNSDWGLAHPCWAGETWPNFLARKSEKDSGKYFTHGAVNGSLHVVRMRSGLYVAQAGLVGSRNEFIYQSATGATPQEAARLCQDQCSVAVEKVRALLGTSALPAIGDNDGFVAGIRPHAPDPGDAHAEQMRKVSEVDNLAHREAVKDANARDDLP